MNASPQRHAGAPSDPFRASVVWDMTLPWVGFCRPELRATVLPRLKACGYTCISMTMATDDQSVQDTFIAIAEQRAKVLAEPDLYVLVENVEDVIRAKRENKLAVSMHFQGTNALGRRLELIEAYYKLGVRHMLMAYNQKNSVGDGCHERTDCGLSRFGQEVVAEMNRVGMLVDVSHTGYRTSMDVFECSSAPVVFSHSNAKAVVDHPRNITDDQAKACARSGGVIGLNGIGVFLGDNDPSTENLYRQASYYKDLVGCDHIGLGIDFVADKEELDRVVHSSASRYPAGSNYEHEHLHFVQPEQVEELANLMLRRGFSPGEVEGILGRNWMRVAGAVWK